MKNNNDGIGLIAWILAFVSIVLGCILISMHNDAEQVVNDCGVVVRHYEDAGTTGGKHSHEYHNYLLDVKYDDGRYDSKIVTTDTYYKRQTGERVCFARTIHTPFPAYVWVILGFGVLSFIIAFYKTLDYL